MKQRWEGDWNSQKEELVEAKKKINKIFLEQ